jgi:hypothetical protein
MRRHQPGAPLRFVNGGDAAGGKAIDDFNSRPFDIPYDDSAHGRLLLLVDLPVFRFGRVLSPPQSETLAKRLDFAKFDVWISGI